MVIIGAPVAAEERLYGQRAVAVYEPRGRQHAELAVTAADELLPRLEDELGHALEGRVEILICRTHGDFEREAGHTYGVWVQGVALPSQRRVIVKALPELTFRRVVRHELAHLVLGAVLGGYSNRTPRWLHEGAAKYYSGDWSGQEQATLAEAERTGKLHTIAELAEFPTHPQESAVAYAESYVLVDYLLSLDPSSGLATFIVHLKETDDVGRALRRAYGMSEAQVQAGWREAVRERSRRSPRPWAVEAAIFSVMVLIFGVAVARVRKRSREIRARMEEEELLERLLGDVRAPSTGTPSRPDDQAREGDDNASGTS